MLIQRFVSVAEQLGPTVLSPADSEYGMSALIRKAEAGLRQQRREVAVSRFLVGLGLFLAANAMGRWRDTG